MFSGKTTELIRRLKRYTFAQYRCLIVRYAKDNRYSEECIASHDGQTMSATSCINLYDIIAFVDRFDVIGIDEGQFVSYKLFYIIKNYNINDDSFTSGKKKILNVS